MSFTFAINIRKVLARGRNSRTCTFGEKKLKNMIISSNFGLKLI